MRLSILTLAAASALTAGAAQAASIDLRDAVLRVTVVPEDRRDVRVDVVSQHPQLPLEIRTQGDRTVVDGNLGRRIHSCNGMGQRAKVGVRGVGQVDYDEMPRIVIHAPRDVVVSNNGAVVGEIGRSGSLELAGSGCTHWTIADVAGAAEIRESGAGQIRMGAADRLTLKMSGAANIHATRIRQGLDATLSGAGGLKVDELNGPLKAQVSGVGRIEVADGRASDVTARVSGVGGVDFDGVAGSVDATVSGIGGVRVKSATGPVRKQVSGIGHVRVGEGG